MPSKVSANKTMSIGTPKSKIGSVNAASRRFSHKEANLSALPITDQPLSWGQMAAADVR
jgi:hypothetical protein